MGSWDDTSVLTFAEGGQIYEQNPDDALAGTMMT